MKSVRVKAVFALLLIAFSTSASAKSSSLRLRLMTGNISSGNKQSYDNGEGIRIFQGLKPDVVMIQEFNYKDNSPAAIAEFVKTAFGKKYRFYRENEPSDQIPNGVISRFPIVESGEWEDSEMPNRDFAWAHIDIPGDRNLWAISVHLSSSKAKSRAAEAKKLAELIKEKVPAKDFVVLGGDFNVRSRQDEIIEILSSSVSEKSAPVDSEGRTETNIPHNKNYDWLLTDNDLEKYAVPVTFKNPRQNEATEGTNKFSTGLVFDSSTFKALDLVAPIKKGDSIAPGMQHFPIVKDFLLPL